MPVRPEIVAMWDRWQETVEEENRRAIDFGITAHEAATILAIAARLNEGVPMSVITSAFDDALSLYEADEDILRQPIRRFNYFDGWVANKVKQWREERAESRPESAGTSFRAANRQHQWQRTIRQILRGLPEGMPSVRAVAHFIINGGMGDALDDAERRAWIANEYKRMFKPTEDVGTLIELFGEYRVTLYK